MQTGWGLWGRCASFPSATDILQKGKRHLEKPVESHDEICIKDNGDEISLSVITQSSMSAVKDQRSLHK